MYTNDSCSSEYGLWFSLPLLLLLLLLLGGIPTTSPIDSLFHNHEVWHGMFWCSTWQDYHLSY